MIRKIDADIRTLSPQYLNECFYYEDGRLFWKDRPRDHFNSDAKHTGFNERHSGKEAFTNINSTHNYHQHNVSGRNLLRAYVVWVLHNNCLPDRSIKRRNKDRSDDRIENLHLTVLTA